MHTRCYFCMCEVVFVVRMFGCVRPFPLLCCWSDDSPWICTDISVLYRGYFSTCGTLLSRGGAHRGQQWKGHRLRLLSENHDTKNNLEKVFSGGVSFTSSFIFLRGHTEKSYKRLQLERSLYQRDIHSPQALLKLMKRLPNTWWADSFQGLRLSVLLFIPSLGSATQAKPRWAGATFCLVCPVAVPCIMYASLCG